MFDSYRACPTNELRPETCFLAEEGNTLCILDNMKNIYVFLKVDYVWELFLSFESKQNLHSAFFDLHANYLLTMGKLERFKYGYKSFSRARVSGNNENICTVIDEILGHDGTLCCSDMKTRDLLVKRRELFRNQSRFTVPVSSMATPGTY